MIDKEILKKITGILLCISLTINFVQGLIIIEYRDLIMKENEVILESWEAMTIAMDALNNTKNYINDQRETIDELTILNIAWSMYVITGNESWLPQNRTEITTVDNYEFSN